MPNQSRPSPPPESAHKAALIAGIRAGKTLAQAGRDVGISRERARQILSDWHRYLDCVVCHKPVELGPAGRARRCAVHLAETRAARRSPARPDRAGWKTSSIYRPREVNEFFDRVREAFGFTPGQILRDLVKHFGETLMRRYQREADRAKSKKRRAA